MNNKGSSEKEKIIKNLFVSKNGLTSSEVKKRREKYGINELPKEKHDHIWKIFLMSFKDPIIFVLFIAAFLSLVANEVLDAIAIILIVLIDGVVSTVQEYKAEKNSETLKNLIKVKCKVIRDEETFIPKGLPSTRPKKIPIPIEPTSGAY